MLLKLWKSKRKCGVAAPREVGRHFPFLIQEGPLISAPTRT